MGNEIIDGKMIAAAIHAETKRDVVDLKKSHNLQPGLAVVLVGEDPASKVYVGMKVKKSRELGIFSKKCVLPEDATQEQVLETVQELNNDPLIHGILVQSPPPPQIDEAEIVRAIKPEKDVDCFHPVNVGKMLLGEEDGFLPTQSSTGLFLRGY